MKDKLEAKRQGMIDRLAQINAQLDEMPTVLYDQAPQEQKAIIDEAQHLKAQIDRLTIAIEEVILIEWAEGPDVQAP